MNINFDWKYIVLLAVIVCLIIRSCKKESKYEQQMNMVAAALDTLKSSRNSMGEMESEISAFRASNAKYFTEMQAINEGMANLQKLVKNTKGKVTNATIHTVETIYKDTGSVEIKYVQAEGGIKQVGFPLIAKDSSRWLNGIVKVFEAHSEWELNLYNEFEYTNVSKKKGFLGMKGTEYKITARNKNPYTETTQLNSFVLYQKPRRIGVGFFIGMGGHLTDGTLNISPVGGIGLSYNILTF